MPDAGSISVDYCV